MGTSFYYQKPLWYIVFLVGMIGCFFVQSPEIVLGQTPAETEPIVFDLPDGSRIQFTENAITRTHSSPEASEQADVLWAIQAQSPQGPLLFENSDNVPLLLYFTQIDEYSGEFHAIQIEDGEAQWVHPTWWKITPVSPVLVPPWIYFGRGLWLEKMEADTGRIVARYPARVRITALRVLPNNDIEVLADEPEAGQISLSFHQETFSPQVTALGGSNLLVALDLFKRGQNVMSAFYDEYLRAYIIEKELPAPDILLKSRHFSLQKTERVYRQAYQEDLANPYFALYLALSLYYQDRETEAERYFQEALRRNLGFWEESFRLGGLCEDIGLTQWADLFYEQGTTRYFQDVPAPPKDVTLIEILILLFSMRRSSALFAHGQTERALHLVDVRRQVFPYAEAENKFSRQYARWLRQMGQEAKAIQEEQRIGQVAIISDFEELSPWSFVGIMIAGFMAGGIVLVRNEFRHWHEFAGAVIVTIMITGGAYWYLQSGIMARLLSFGIVPLTILLIGYVGIIAFFRRRRMLRQEHASFRPSLRKVMLGITVSSYIVILAGVFIVYIVGTRLGDSLLIGKVAEIGFLVGFLLVRRSVQRRSGNIFVFQNPASFMVIWALLWCYLAWGHYHFLSNGMANFYVVGDIDRGNPNWIASIDREVEDARFRTKALLCIQATSHQLGEDDDFARSIYQEIPQDPRALNNLGVMDLQHDPNSARQYFEHALRIDPDCAPALYNLGILTDDATLLEHAQNIEPWRVNAYQQYAPGKPWIAVFTVREWHKSVYWASGGFWVRGFTEIPLFFRDVLRVVLETLRYQSF